VTFLLVLIIAMTVAGIALVVEMYRRDQPEIGAAGLGVLLGVNTLSCVYGMLDSI
jgi:hypothetical protein